MHRRGVQVLPVELEHTGLGRRALGSDLSSESNIFPLVKPWRVAAAPADPLQGTILVLTPSLDRGWYGQTACSCSPSGGRGCSLGVHWDAFKPLGYYHIFVRLFWLVTLGLHGFWGRLFELYVKGLELRSGYSIWYQNQKSLFKLQPNKYTLVLPQVTGQKHPFLLCIKHRKGQDFPSVAMGNGGNLERRSQLMLQWQWDYPTLDCAPIWTDPSLSFLKAMALTIDCSFTIISSRKRTGKLVSHYLNLIISSSNCLPGF